MRLICTKIQIIGDKLEFVYKNPQMSLHELCLRIEDKIDLEEKEIVDAQTFVEKELIFHRMITSEWLFSIVKSVLLKYKR